MKIIHHMNSERLKQFEEIINSNSSYELAKIYPFLEDTKAGIVKTIVSIHPMYIEKQGYIVPKGFIVHILEDDNFYRVPEGYDYGGNFAFLLRVSRTHDNKILILPHKFLIAQKELSLYPKQYN